MIPIWGEILKKAIDIDGWGQVEEAKKEYVRLMAMIKKQGQQKCPQNEKVYLAKVYLCLERRTAILSTMKSGSSEVQEEGRRHITARDLSSLIDDFENVRRKEDFFPLSIDPSLFNDEKRFREIMKDMNAGVVGSTVTLSHTDSYAGEKTTSSPLLLPPPPFSKGSSFLTITIKKIGLKDWQKYIDSFMTVAVYDRNGEEMEEMQRSAMSTRREDEHIIFEQKFHIQTSISDLHKHDCAVAFAFNHFKVKKRKISTRCWAFIDTDEMKKGPAALELYKKPVDAKRKKLHLHTIKRLFLQISIDIRQDN